jgi:mevalonate kinase
MVAKTYPAKILLFGEYTILFGGKGVVIPYPKYFGEWAFGQKDHQYFEQSKELFKFIKSIKEQNSKATDLFQFFDLNDFSQDLMEGIYFHSSIPQGLGMGSSGALCAAIWDRYFRTKDAPALNLIETRYALALIEAFYHHSSSGLDPLVSLVNRPLCLHGHDHIHLFDDDTKVLQHLHGLYLLNTGVSRKTAPLVQLFKNKMQDFNFKQNFEENFLPLSDKVAVAWMEKNINFRSLMIQFSAMQLELFPEYFSKDIREIALEGINSKQFSIKLCGAGGGGVYLLVDHELNKDRNFNLRFPKICMMPL